METYRSTRHSSRFPPDRGVRDAPASESLPAPHHQRSTDPPAPRFQARPGSARAHMGHLQLAPTSTWGTASSTTPNAQARASRRRPNALRRHTLPANLAAAPPHQRVDTSQPEAPDPLRRQTPSVDVRAGPPTPRDQRPSESPAVRSPRRAAHLRRRPWDPPGPETPKGAASFDTAPFAVTTWQRPTLPRVCTRSTIGAEGLNDSVRNGKRCFPLAMATRNL